MAGRCATETYAKNLGGTGTATANKLCTATRASSTFGCTVASGYSGSRIVVQSALSVPSVTLYVTIQYTSVNYTFAEFALIESQTGEELYTSAMYTEDEEAQWPTNEAISIKKNASIIQARVSWYQSGSLKSGIATASSPYVVTGGENLAIRVAGSTVSFRTFS